MIRKLLRPARYLLRLDDLCPAMPAERWQRYFSLIDELGIKPILAVVAANHDTEIEGAAPDPEFWRKMRALETSGAAIALHGYHHLALGRGRSMIPLHPRSEFAGIPSGQQRSWIADGLRILRGHGLDPKIWIAPQHGFDLDTLRALEAESIRFVSDGFARIPFTRGGVTWIPQQLWGPVEKGAGLWTICMHPTTAGDVEFDRLRAFMRGHREQFTSFDWVAEECHAEELPLGERMYEKLALWRFCARRWRGNRRQG